MADIGAFYENVVITFLIVITFLVLILAFLYMIWGREEKPTTTTTAPKRNVTWEFCKSLQ